MADEKQVAEHGGGRHSREADAAAARWEETHPGSDVDHPPPSHVPEDPHIVPDHHSASAEAAALRWYEAHEDEDF
ncbi:MAG: hypothetical protein ABSG43_07390 [Solirubrobacteraceae bacterium]|jgi:hypothetical protein